MTEFLYRHLFTAMWLAWALCWWLASRDVKQTRREEPLVPVAETAVEEWWLQELFGRSYTEYARRVPALIPFINSV